MGSIVDTALANQDFSTLVSLLQLVNEKQVSAVGTPFVLDMLSSKGGSEWEGNRFTVFAPTNGAFAKLPAHVVSFLQNNPDVLLKVLQYHILLSEVFAANVIDMFNADKAQGMATHVVSTASGQNVHLKVDEVGTVWVGNDKNGFAHVVTADVRCENGVIHVIDSVIIPEDIDPASIPVV